MLGDIGVASRPETRHFLDHALSRLEWAIIAVLLLLTLAQPSVGRAGLPTWLLVLMFAVYSLLYHLLQRWVPRLRSFTLKYVLDLPITALVYFLGPRPGGLLFVLFFLAVVCAAASLSLSRSLVYLAAVAAIVVALDATFATWSWMPVDIEALSARLVALAIFGAGTAILTRRLTLEQAAAHAVRAEAERLEVLDRLRDDFIATVSHDLRTPLSAARAALILLQTSAVDRHQPDERAMVDNARRNIERLSLLIDDLLTHNQLEAGTLRLDRAPLDLRAVVTAAIAAVHPLIREKGQLLEMDLPEPLPTEGDPRRLEQVVVTLLANAHHHTPPGTRITLSGRITGSDVVLVLRDNGPGIPSEELEAIFRRFHRLTSAGGGSGLGLAIAQRIVSLHGGRIWVESRLGAGATFYIALARHCNGDKR